MIGALRVKQRFLHKMLFNMKIMKQKGSSLGGTQKNFKETVFLIWGTSPYF